MRYCSIKATHSADLTGAFVQDCSHAPSEDDQLFDHQASSQAAAAAPAAQKVILAYDERMSLHVEGRLSTHPERPDRIRAVMARLTASGLTGVPLLACNCTCRLLCNTVHHCGCILVSYATAYSKSSMGHDVILCVKGHRPGYS